MAIALRLLARAGIAGVLALCAASARTEPLVLHYFDRPPFMAAETANEGKVTGLVASPVAEAFAKAGIQVTWLRVPAARQLVVLQENRQRACGLGWFRNPEREQFAKFSRPIYQDQQMVILANIGYKPNPATLAEFFGEPRLRLLVKRGFSYGPLIDGQIRGMASPPDEVSAEIEQIFQMLAKGRADAAFVAAEEADHLLATHPSDARQLRRIALRELPKGERRYLMCSQSVDEDTLRRFNTALAVHLP